VKLLHAQHDEGQLATLLQTCLRNFDIDLDGATRFVQLSLERTRLREAEKKENSP
jgi:hypothetical protein